MEIRMVEWTTILFYGYCFLDDLCVSDEIHALWIAAGGLEISVSWDWQHFTRFHDTILRGKTKPLNSNIILFEMKGILVSSFVTKSLILLQNFRKGHLRKNALYSYSFATHRSRKTGIWQAQSFRLWIKQTTLHKFF